MNQKPDIYDREVERLTRQPWKIDAAWVEAQPLFRYLEPMHVGFLHPGGNLCGRATLIKRGTHVAYTDELTEMVRSNPHIPISPADITPAHLPHFAELMRKAGKILGWKDAE